MCSTEETLSEMLRDMAKLSGLTGPDFVPGADFSTSVVRKAITTTEDEDERKAILQSEVKKRLEQRKKRQLARKAEQEKKALLRKEKLAKEKAEKLAKEKAEKLAEEKAEKLAKKSEAGVEETCMSIHTDHFTSASQLATYLITHQKKPESLGGDVFKAGDKKCKKVAWALFKRLSGEKKEVSEFKKKVARAGTK